MDSVFEEQAVEKSFPKVLNMGANTSLTGSQHQWLHVEIFILENRSKKLVSDKKKNKNKKKTEAT